MKNKKVVLIVTVIVVIILLLVVSIFIGKLISKSDEADLVQPVENNILDNNNVVTDIQNEGNESSEEEYKEIVTNSKIGVSLQEIIRISNIYSEEYCKVLDLGQGLTDDAKRIFTYSRFVTDEENKKDIRYSENYVGSYITKKDFDTLAQKIYGKNTNLDGKDIIYEDTYDEENNNYVISPIGICGNSFYYTLDVPYKMLEYDERIEVYVYRLYIIQNVQTIPDSLSLVDQVYSDPDRKNLVLTIEDSSVLSDESVQTYNILDKINESSVDTNTLKKGVYVIKKENDNRYIDSYKNL